MPKKNDVVEIEITDLTSEGAGIGRADGYPLFVNGAVIGDKIRALVVKDKKTYGYGKIIEITEPSPDRVEPACAVALRCGGCSLQALSYDAQLAYKERLVKESLTRIGGISDPQVLPIISMESPVRYRNKAEYPVRMSESGQIEMGFYGVHSHRVIPCDDCVIGQRTDAEILRQIREWMLECGVSAYDEDSGSGVLRHVLIRTSSANGHIMVCLIINADSLKGAGTLAERLADLPDITSLSYCVNKRRDNVIMGDKVHVISGDGFIEDEIGGISFRISPQSFYQVNHVQTEKLYAAALDYADLTGDEVVLDLYCGIGTISLFLAQKARMVYGVEIVPAAVSDARENAARNHIGNAQFIVGAAEEVVPERFAAHGNRPDVVVVDPPRKGCDEVLIKTILSMSPDRVVYVSCNPATLARDVKLLTEGGYHFIKAQPVDMFPQVHHVETVVLLVRKTPDAYVRIKMDMEDFDLTKPESAE